MKVFHAALLLLLVPLVTATQANTLERRQRAITPAAPADRKDHVEGSGEPPKSDTEVVKKVGYSPDDEDAVEGSGSPPPVAGGKHPAAPSETISTTVHTVVHNKGHEDDADEVTEGSGRPETDDHEVKNYAVGLPTTTTTTEGPPLTTRRTWDPIPEEPARTTPRSLLETTRRVPASTPRTPSSTEAPLFPFSAMLKPGIFAAVIGGTVVGLLMAILLVMFIVYRMRKRDEGSYALEENKGGSRPYAGYAYTKASSTKEFYA